MAIVMTITPPGLKQPRMQFCPITRSRMWRSALVPHLYRECLTSDSRSKVLKHRTMARGNISVIQSDVIETDADSPEEELICTNWCINISLLSALFSSVNPLSPHKLPGLGSGHHHSWLSDLTFLGLSLVVCRNTEILMHDVQLLISHDMWCA